MHPGACWLKTHIYIISELCTTVHSRIMKRMHVRKCTCMHTLMGIVRCTFALITFVFHVLAILQVALTSFSWLRTHTKIIFDWF